MPQYTLSARIRGKKGKGAARALRQQKEVPAVFYGPNSDPLMLTVHYSDLDKLMKKVTSENFILGLQIESDENPDTKMVMIKELQVNPIVDKYIHADFYELSMSKRLTVDIPLRLVNTPKGIVNGGVLQHVRREITVSCLPDELIEFIDVDVSELDIGDILHVRDIKLPEGVEALTEDHLTIVTVNAPKISASEEEIIEEEESGKTDSETESPS